MVVSTALTPLLAWLFIGPALPLSPAALGLRLFLILTGALAVAVSLRGVAGPAAIRCYKGTDLRRLDNYGTLVLRTRGLLLKRQWLSQ
jgi:BASS family bile acid:Na+ symporter